MSDEAHEDQWGARSIDKVRWCAAVQTPVNCHCQLEDHPVGDVEPVKFFMQYLT